jgi:hypothetical protein
VVVVQQGMPACDPISVSWPRPRPLPSGRVGLGPRAERGGDSKSATVRPIAGRRVCRWGPLGAVRGVGDGVTVPAAPAASGGPCWPPRSASATISATGAPAAPR